MRTREQIVSHVEAFLERSRTTERAFSLAVAGDHKFLRRLREGAGVTLTLIEKAEAHIAAWDAANGDATPPGAGTPPAREAAA